MNEEDEVVPTSDQCVSALKAECIHVFDDLIYQIYQHKLIEQQKNMSQNWVSHSETGTEPNANINDCDTEECIPVMNVVNWMCTAEDCFRETSKLWKLWKIRMWS